ncbi:MAG TPA: class I SAM-dependent methyltransferase [Conexibacter sp.]|jgi:2-polyprenyl-3-methyl-5-hydroxy-6-metoxy-1,4-benzoquinol methylase|nr:class I SAM-dependent methyltransferase [Conexibacter sp.]
MVDPSHAFLVTEDKGYYANDRAELVARLPRPVGHVLDVGCGAGEVGRSLRAAGATSLVGVELNPTAAAAAEEHFDKVLVGDAESLVRDGALTGPFDTLVLYDVLEHLVDPAALLSALAPLVVPGGSVHVSVPNARHFSLMRDLVVRGTFGYTDWGHRDRTHLRWFTRRDIVALLADGGWQIEDVSPSILGRNRIVDRLTLGRAREFIALQWAVLATR